LELLKWLSAKKFKKNTDYYICTYFKEELTSVSEKKSGRTGMIKVDNWPEIFTDWHINLVVHIFWKKATLNFKKPKVQGDL